MTGVHDCDVEQQKSSLLVVMFCGFKASNTRAVRSADVSKRAMVVWRVWGNQREKRVTLSHLYWRVGWMSFVSK